ncbi:MAG: restriction endonuclease subunit S [Candidatus Omnitrophota bacterium]|nr:restriction endonuclease subunit S [Candidatus Omnitrophota bacterium]
MTANVRRILKGFKKTELGETPDEWSSYKLSEIMEIIGGGTPKTTVAEYWGGGIFWLSVVDFGGGNRWVYRTEKMITQKGLNGSSTKILKKGQLVISARGTVGEIAQLGCDMAFNQSCYGLDGKLDVVLNNFLYYLLKFNIQNFKQNTHGAVFDTITRQTFDCIDVNVPPIEEQRAIAQILSGLDGKIELNQLMNRTLEAIGQALFKRWFVDFDFPDKNGKLYKLSGGKMVDSELGDIPEGWAVKEVSDCGEVVCGKTPPTADKDNYGDDIFFITIPDMRGQVFVIKTERKLSEKGTLTQTKKELPSLSICVSCIATPGLVSLTSTLSHTNQQINSIVCNKGISPYFMYSTMLDKGEEIKSMGLGGTATLNLNTGNFARIKIAIPEKATMDAFHKIITPSMEKILCNSIEIDGLCNIRDSLLPRLMSGKIRV